MFTLEEKINIALSYIATDDELMRARLKSMAVDAVKDLDAIPNRNASQLVTKTPVDVEELVNEHLRNTGIPAHLLGYDYTAMAIKLVLTNSEYLRAITSWLYPDIAEKYNTTPSRVERAIRHGVEVAFDRGDWNYLVSAFGNTAAAKRGKLTNSEFIAGSVNLIRMQMRKLEEQ